MTAGDADRADADVGGEGVRVRQAEPADAPAVAAFTRDTWSDRHGDYVPETFPEWVETDDATQRTFVAVVDPETLGAVGPDDPEVVADGAVVGCCQTVLLSEWEAWAQGLRVHPAARGRGVSPHLSAAMFRWAGTRGATVCRNMVFSWNVAGLGQSRSVGFDPCAEFRHARPEPDPDATVPDGYEVRAEPDAAWALWERSDARAALGGLAMDDAESWALSALTRDRLHAAADDDRLLTVHDDGIGGFAHRVRTDERETDDGDVETWALYGVAAWETAADARTCYRAVARDAARVGADRVRVTIPETVAAVSDTATARVEVAAEPDFVLAADLTDPAVGRVE